jgi:hypothetical protein
MFYRPADRAMGEVEFVRGPRKIQMPCSGFEGRQGVERRQSAGHDDKAICELW